MVKTELVEETKRAGRNLLSKLDESGLDIRAAFWHYDFDREQWAYVFASPIVDQLGAREFYVRIHPMWQAAVELHWSRPQAVGLDDNLVQLLNSVAHTGPGIHGIAHDRWMIAGTFVGEAYIYRMNL